MAAGLVLTGASEFAPGDLLITAGAAAAFLALLGLALVLPLYLNHRREVLRLLRWQEREPGRGEGSQATDPLFPTAGAAADATAEGRALSPAERVTADRPALQRITAERAALQSPSRWTRFMARGPRHPLLLSLFAVAVAAAAVVLAVSLSEPNQQEPKERTSGLDRAAVATVVLNASSTPALADKLAETLELEGFTEIRTGTTGTSTQTLVLFDKGERRGAQAVAKRLGVGVIQPLDRTARAAAPDADVVVIAGEDQANGKRG